MGKKKKKADYSYYKHHPIFKRGYDDASAREEVNKKYYDALQEVETRSRKSFELHNRDMVCRSYLYYRANFIMANQAIDMIGDREALLLLPDRFTSGHSLLPLYNGSLNLSDQFQVYYGASERALGFLEYLSASESIMENNRKVVDSIMRPYVGFHTELENIGSFDRAFALQYLNSQIQRKVLPDNPDMRIYKQDPKLNEKFTLSDPIEIDFADFYLFVVSSGRASASVIPPNAYQFNSIDNANSLINYWEPICGFYLLDPGDHSFISKIVIDNFQLWLNSKGRKIPLIDCIIAPNQKVFLVTERDSCIASTEEDVANEAPADEEPVNE